MTDTPLAPSDAERGEWPNNTRNYVEWLELRFVMLEQCVTSCADSLDDLRGAKLGIMRAGVEFVRSELRAAVQS